MKKYYSSHEQRVSTVKECFAAQLRDSKRVGVKTPHSKLLCGARALASRTINAMQYLDCIVN